VAGNIVEGSGSIGADTLILQKYDNAGTLIWKQYASGQGGSWSVRSIATDAAGNSCITGQFFSTSLKFGNTTITNSSNGQLIFIARYTTAGSLQWVTPTGQFPSVYEPAISLDANGNSYVTGYFNGNFAAFGTSTLSNSGWNDMFITKLDNQGNIIWAKQGGGNMHDQGNACSVEASGNILVTGFFTNFAAFGPVNVFGSGALDVYVIKYDSNGNVLWGRSAGGTLNDRGADICAENGKIYVAGDFTSAKPSFGNNLLVNCDTVQMPYEAFVAKLSGATGGTITSMSTGLSGSTEFQILPNPFQSELKIFSPIPLDNPVVILMVVSGREVLRLGGQSGRHLIVNRIDLAEGIYLLKVFQAADLLYKGRVIVCNQQ
jgi:hypothetical protein